MSLTVRSRLGWLLVPVVMAVVLAACGGGDEPSAEAGDDETGAATSSTATPAADDREPTTTEAPATTSSTAPSTTTEPEPEIEPVVYDGDFSASIAPILAERCASCHAPGGPGTAHWELATVADAADNHRALLEVIETGFMPPWPAGGDSPRFADDRSLRPDQLKAVLDWATAGGEIDVDPGEAIAPASAVVGLADPDVQIVPEQPYAGSLSTVDDYRCQIYDPQLSDGGWITSYEFVPDQTEVVHHAIGYLIPADRRDRALERDGEDGKPGWSCYGSSGLGADELFLGWAPGQDPTVYPDGTGLWVDPGAFIVVQVHYHYEVSAPADASALALEVAPSGDDLEPIEVATLVAPAEIPCRDGEDGPLCDRDTAIAAAREKYGNEGVQADAILQICRAEVADFAAMTDGTASSSCDIPVRFVDAIGEVVAVFGHQHELGDWFRMTLNPGKPDKRVLLDIPDWDFDWQYNYVPVDRIVIDGDDIIRVECGWDRSLRDPTLEPAYVLWADGTDDEMCFATVTTRPVDS
ncbi:MAG: hypothetical protein AAGA93_23400 [Actinomycetota bacterium]